MKRAELVETKHPELSIRRQCELLHVRRSVFYYKPMEPSESERRIIRALDEIYLIDPCMGSRRLVAKLSEDYGMESNRKQVQSLRREMGIETIWCRPRRTCLPDNGHRKYPYLLKGRNASEADEHPFYNIQLMSFQSPIRPQSQTAPEIRGIQKWTIFRLFWRNSGRRFFSAVNLLVS